jgi:hypothetical protein
MKRVEPRVQWPGLQLDSNKREAMARPLADHEITGMAHAWLNNGNIGWR